MAVKKNTEPHENEKIKKIIKNCENKTLIEGDDSAGIHGPSPSDSGTLREKLGYYSEYYIKAKGGNDKLFGGPNDDCYSGGEGANIFKVTKIIADERIGDDVIIDFKINKYNKLEIAHKIYSTVNKVKNSIKEYEYGVKIPFGNIGSITILGINKDDLNESNCIIRDYDIGT